MEKLKSGITRSLLELAADSAVQAELPDIDRYARNLTNALEKHDLTSAEDSLLMLYTRLHGAGAVYSLSEKELLARRKGYSCLPGGLSPLIMAAEFIKPYSVVVDLGAGNGLQGLLLQSTCPHRKTIQVEISSELIRVGQIFQQALGLNNDRVEWIHDDLVNASIDEADFVYLYLPAKPLEGGKEVYEAIARKIDAMQRPLVIFSVADCLATFLRGQFSVFYTDGHLTCLIRD